jgi:hypothetical protein
MKLAEQADGPLRVELHDGVVLLAACLDGGGAFVGEHPVTGQPGFMSYEVHGTYADGGFLCVPQSQIARVLDAAGEEVEFGNPYMPGHPRPVS